MPPSNKLYSRMKKILFFLISIVIFASCEKETSDPGPQVNLPVSNFSYVISNPFPPAEVVFTNGSAYSSTYFWEFGDGSTSTEINPVHTYNASGGFTVSLTAADTLGNTKKSSQVISIQELPTRILLKSFTINQMPFTNQVGQVWDPSDGPDVYVSFQELSYDIITQTPVMDNITESELPVAWTWNSPYFDMVDIGHKFLIVFVEYDGPNLLAGMETPIEFDFDNYSGYPEFIEMTSPNGTFEIKLEIIWE